MKALVYGWILILVVGCASTPKQTILNACRTYDATLRTLVVYKAEGKLSASQIASVDTLRPVLNAICLDGQITDTASAIDTLERGLFTLNGIKGGVE